MSKFHQTTETIAWLREIADRLEAIQGDFPHLTWWHAYHKGFFNGGMRGIGTDIRKDADNAHKGTHVRHGGPQLSQWVKVFADVNIRGNHKIMVLEIKNVQMCYLKSVRRRIMEAVADLPDEAKLSICRIMASIRRAKKSKKDARLLQLCQEMAELEAL